MTHEREEANGAFGVIRSPRARAARYRDHAAHFARLAEAEKPFENPLRGMPLLPRGSLIRCQDPDDPGKRIQLRARRRSTAPVPGRHENAGIFATVRGSIPKRRAASRRLNTFYLNCITNLSIELHALHPRPLPLSDKGYLLLDFHSGATGLPGRFSEGFLLRRFQIPRAS
jgi:hypothetical protein